MASTEKKQEGVKDLKPGDKPPLAQHDSTILDLAFAMDTTGSMGSYIQAAQQSLRQIVEEIVASEKSDVHLALVEYRDHPPQETSFVTRVHDFTDSVKTMKTWLDASSADGGGDHPEAVADAMHDVLKLSWRPEATKICVFISDAPPHGLGDPGDGFPDGCPLGLDPVQIINQMAEKNITMYSVGCEPSINQYRDFFMALAHITGGQYVPLGNASLLAKVIIGGAQEEITLQRLMEDVHEEVMEELQARGGVEGIDEDELATRVQTKLASKGAKGKALYRNDAKLECASAFAQDLSKKNNMSEWKTAYASNIASDTHTKYGRMMKCPMYAPPMACRTMMACAPSRDAPVFDAPPAMESSIMPESLEAAPPAESYKVVEEDINIEQSKRMVKKSLAMNKLKFSK